MKTQKIFYSSLLVSSFLFVSHFNSVAKAQVADSLTSEQRSCLEAKLGKPGVGERPSREKAEAAFTACNVDRSSLKHGRGADQEEQQGQMGRGGRERRGPPPGFENLTETQKNCLKSNLGEPGSGERPSREKMDATLAKCNIQLPELNDEARGSGRQQQYQAQQKQKSSVNQ